MPRPSTEKRDPFTITRGTVIRTPGGNDDVVRSVAVVLSMASGEDIVYQEGEEVAILEKQPPAVRSVERKQKEGVVLSAPEESPAPRKIEAKKVEEVILVPETDAGPAPKGRQRGPS